MMSLDPEILSAARAAREQMLERQHELDRARTDLNHEIRRLHAAGGSMREISEQLGVSHQRVHQIVNDDQAAADPLRRRLGARLHQGLVAGRFTDEARAAVVAGVEEASASGAASVLPEHLLLALAAPGAGASARALASAGASPESLRAAAGRAGDPARPRGRGRSRGRTPFAAATKKALELSAREALRLGDHHIASEHLLLGLLRGADDRLESVLDEAGITPAAIRDAL